MGWRVIVVENPIFTIILYTILYTILLLFLHEYSTLRVLHDFKMGLSVVDAQFRRIFLLRGGQGRQEAEGDERRSSLRDRWCDQKILFYESVSKQCYVDVPKKE